MANVPDPNSKPATPPSSPQPSGPEPKCVLLAMCTGPGERGERCGDGIEFPLPLDQRTLSLSLAQQGWFISVLNPPGQGTDAMVLGPLCAACAQQVYPPEVFAAAEQRRQQLLEFAAQQAQQAGQVPR